MCLEQLWNAWGFVPGLEIRGLPYRKLQSGCLPVFRKPISVLSVSAHVIAVLLACRKKDDFCLGAG